MLELRIFIWGKAGSAESVNLEFGNEELGMQSSRVGVPLPLQTILCFPELEKNWNLIPVMVAVSVIAVS